MIYRVQRFAGIVAATVLLAPLSAHATNGYQLIGIGSHQKSVGGAVTANPASAMTAITNPAGMARIGRRADFSMELFMPERHVDFTALGGNRSESASGLYGIPALGWTAPISDDEPDIFFGGGMYGTSGMGVDYGSTYFSPTSPSGRPVYFDGYSSLAFWQMAPTLAWNVNRQLSLGVSLNLNYQSAAFKQRTMSDTNADGVADTTVMNFDLSRTAQNLGVGASVGLLYDLSRSMRLGLSYKSRQEFSDMEYQLGAGDILNVSTASGCPTVSGNVACPGGLYRLALDFPQQAAIGISARPVARLTVSADIKWIDWSATMDQLVIRGPGNVRVTMPTGWDDQTVYALGLSYAVSERFNLHAGMNYAKAPFGDSEVSANLILPATVESHYTLGADYRLNKRWQLATHYMWSKAAELTAPSSDPNMPGARIGLDVRSFGLNLGYLF